MNIFNYGNHDIELPKTGVEIPQNILEIVIKLSWEILKEIGFSNPPARATAMNFFKKTYNGADTSDIKILYYIIASLHLATKVYDDVRSFSDFLSALDTIKSYNSDMVQKLPALNHLGVLTQDRRVQLTSLIINAENDIIYKLDFQFKVQLPYKFSTHISKTIVRWHIPPDDPKKSDALADMIDKLAWGFLNDLQQSNLFYKYSPDIVGLIAVRLSCEICKLPLISPKRMKWYMAALPFRDDDEIIEAYPAIKNVFDEIMTDYKKVTVPIENLDEKMKTFYITPLEDYREIDEMCPPPPIEMMKKIAGPADGFSNSWYDHLPSLPPPPLSLLKEAIYPPRFGVARMKSNYSQPQLPLYILPNEGISVPFDGELNLDSLKLDPEYDHQAYGAYHRSDQRDQYPTDEYQDRISPGPRQSRSYDYWHSSDGGNSPYLRKSDLSYYDERDWDRDRDRNRDRDRDRNRDRDRDRDRERERDRDRNRDRDRDRNREREWNRERDRDRDQRRDRDKYLSRRSPSEDPLSYKNIPSDYSREFELRRDHSREFNDHKRPQHRSSTPDRSSPSRRPNDQQKRRFNS